MVKYMYLDTYLRENQVKDNQKLEVEIVRVGKIGATLVLNGSNEPEGSPDLKSVRIFELSQKMTE